MKFTLLSVAGVLSAISQVSALTIVNPWGSTTWTSGGHGNITWTYTAAEAKLKCDIYLLNGNFNNANIVAQITDPATPVACSAGAYDMYPLNDFASGQYWIRIGQASTNTWTYSAAFNFVGKGSANPISIVSSASSVATAVVGTAAAASSANAQATAIINVTSSKASASASASASSPVKSTSGANTLSASGAAVALGAIAAVALNL